MTTQTNLIQHVRHCKTQNAAVIYTSTQYLRQESTEFVAVIMIGLINTLLWILFYDIYVNCKDLYITHVINSLKNEKDKNSPRAVAYH
jgi:hypothetical protein